MTAIRPFALAKQLVAVPFHFLRHQWKGTASIKAEKYRFGPHRRQYLLFWMPPPGIPLQHSVVVFYHGGGWRLGWPDQFPTVADWFLKRGFPVFMPAYRLLPRYNYLDMRQDLNAALDKILELMLSKGLQDKKILPAGMSAGATLAAHLAFDRMELPESCSAKDYFSGFLSFGGPLALDQMPDVRQLRGFTGGAFGSAAFQKANPMSLCGDQDQLPVLLVHGTDDAIVPFASSAHFFERYSGPKKFYSIPGGSHLDSLGFALHDASASKVVEEWLQGLGKGID